MKTVTVVVLFLIGGLWAAGLSCNSCGSECTSACGTRRFRICCFNHLKRKRGVEPSQVFCDGIGDDVERDDEDYPVMNAIVVIQKPEKWFKKLMFDDPYGLSILNDKPLRTPLK